MLKYLLKIPGLLWRFVGVHFVIWILRFPDFHSINWQCEADMVPYAFVFLDI